MAYGYNSPTRDQLFLLQPSITDWLPDTHLVWFVLEVVSLIDTTEFDKRHPNDGVGRPAYDPQMMLALLIYAYCTGVRSSRRIEASCRTDLAYRAICVQLLPNHVTICRFRVEHEQAFARVFTDVLRLCALAGLASLGTVAIYGTKIGSDAALDANHSEATIRAEVAKIITEAASADDTDDMDQATLVGELPEDLARPGTRRVRLEAALAEIESQRVKDREIAARAQAEAAEDPSCAGASRPTPTRLPFGPKPTQRPPG